MVDAFGKMVRFLLMPGQTHGMKGARPLIEDIALGALMVDETFDTNWRLKEYDERGARAVIPPRTNRKPQRDEDAEA